MKKFKKQLLSLVLALLMVMSTGVFMTAVAEDVTAGGPLPQGYVFNFAHNWENRRLLTNNQMLELLGRNPSAPGAGTPFTPESTAANADATLNADGSLTLSKRGGQRGANLEIPVTDDMRTAFENTAANDNRMTVSFWLSQAMRTVNLMPNTFSNAQVRVYTRFNNSFAIADGMDTLQSYLRISSMQSPHLQAHQQTHMNREFRLLCPANEVLTSLDDVYSIIITLYDYHTPTSAATLHMSGFVYTGEPAVTQFEPPTPKAVDSTLDMVNWGPNYNREWGRPPNLAPRFNPEPSSDWNDFAAVSRSGYMMFRNNNPVDSFGVQRQVDFFFDFDRDEFALAVETANQPGGSGTAQITIDSFDLRDTNGNPMRAEIAAHVVEFGEAEIVRLHENYVWIGDYEQVTIELDVSEITSTNISHVRFAVMQWWFLDETVGDESTPGAYLDLNRPIHEGGRVYVLNDLGERVDVTDRQISPPGAEFTQPVMQNMQFLISPIRIGNPDVWNREGTIVTPPVRPNPDNYGGTPFYAFTPEAHHAYEAGFPGFMDFLYDDYMRRFTRERHGFGYPGGESGVKHTAENWPTTDFVTCEFEPTEPPLPLTHQWYVDAIRESREWSNLQGGVKGGYVLGMRSPFPHSGISNSMHRLLFWSSQERENEWRAGDSHFGLGDHPNIQPLPPQDDDYDFHPMMEEALRRARVRGSEELDNILAIDVYVLRSLHGWRHLRNQVYVDTLNGQGRTPVDQNSAVQVEVMIHARSGDGIDRTVTTNQSVAPGRKTTIYINVGDILSADWIYGVSVSSNNWANLRHMEDGGNNMPAGIVDVHTWFSNIYLPHDYGSAPSYCADGCTPGEWGTHMYPTCEWEGLKVLFCLVCYNVIDMQELPYAPHTVTDWTVTREPTCTVAGERRGECDECGEEVVQAIQPLGHAWAGVAAINPTCVAPGRAAGRRCTRCGYQQLGAAVAARGHSPVPNNPRIMASFFTTTLVGRTICRTCNQVLANGRTVPRRTLGRARITLRATGNRRVRVTTNRVANANRYQFQFRRQGQRAWRNGGFVSGRNRNIARLTRGRNYQFRVRAARVQGRQRANGPWSVARRIRVR